MGGSESFLIPVAASVASSLISGLLKGGGGDNPISFAPPGISQSGQNKLPISAGTSPAMMAILENLMRPRGQGPGGTGTFSGRDLPYF